MQISISKLVNQKRLAQGLTIERLAERAGVSISLISRIERGEIDNISLNKLQAIADALNIRMGEFFGDEHLSGIHTLDLLNYLRALPENKREAVAESILRILKL